MDGTLTDSEPLWHEAEHALIARHGRVVDPDIQKTFTGVDSPTMIARLRAAYGVAASEAQLLAELMTDVRRLLAAVPARAGAADLLHWLAEQDVPRALVSNSARELIELSLSAQPWGYLLEHRLSAEDVTHAKPAPDLYLLAAERLGADPAACLVLEDSLTGVRAAAAADMTVYAVPSDPEPDLEAFRALTPYVFGSLVEVGRQLENLG